MIIDEISSCLVEVFLKLASRAQRLILFGDLMQLTDPLNRCFIHFASLNVQTHMLKSNHRLKSSYLRTVYEAVRIGNLNGINITKVVFHSL